MRHLVVCPLLFVLVAAACGNAKPRCLKSNCGGCCDVNGECRTGNEDFACGFGANSCSSCSQLEVCLAGGCTPKTSDGGVVVVPPDGGCSASTCGGCCDGMGICRGGNSNGACGASGAACAACPTGKSCQSNACQTFTCTGCLATGGNCLLGTAPSACGADGGMCKACLNGETCAGGACVQAVTCNASNCSTGCCAGATCINNTTAQQCGTGGASCVACQAPQVCSAGSCTTPIPDAGMTGPCGPSTCSSGCCDILDGHCAGGGSTLACGRGGVTCEVCSALPFICYQHSCL